MFANLSAKKGGTMQRSLQAIALLLLAGCGDKLPFGGGISLESIVVRSQARFTVTANHGVNERGETEEQPVTVINAPASSMALDNSDFAPPAVSNTLLDFGTLRISALQDNDLKVCGPNGNKKCSRALLRVYTTGTGGAGLFNAEDGYGMPITATLSAPLTIGLDAANAAVMQTIAIPNNKRVLRLSDFTPAPAYRIHSDFTEAGAGSFSTTIVVEYALAD